MSPPTIRERTISCLADLRLLHVGKVREVYDAGGEALLLVTSSRVSAFDVVFPDPVPFKAEVLNLLSAYWFARTRHLVPNHLLETRRNRLFAPDAPEVRSLRGRVALVRRTTPVRFECVVRGHLDGSAWREYERTGAVAGHALPAGLKRYDKLPEPIFTPATKAESGHDENITVEQLRDAVGTSRALELEEASLCLYRFAYEELLARGIALLDTKLEFGEVDGTLMLIDEAFTPDSSRFRVIEQGTALALDKQFLRDWLTAHSFRGDGPPPALPREIIEELSRRYRAAFERITGETIESAIGRIG